jgi:flagellin FlaB
VNNMKNENENARDSVAAIGIGAMIVFIALVLVAAVASAVIIQTGEKLQQNAQKTGADTQQEIGGKISIITVNMGAFGTATTVADEIQVVFELAPGSEPIDDTQVIWSIVCLPTGTTAIIMNGDFNTVDTAGNAATDLIGTTVTTFNPGNVYMINLIIGNAAGDDTACNAKLNEEHTMLISVEGGGSTYELLSFTDLTQGASVV